MPIISRINLVEIPSEQPDTPQPMTGEALGVFEKQTFIDPPISDRKNTFFFVHLYNTSKNRISSTAFVNGFHKGYANDGGGFVDVDIASTRINVGYLGMSGGDFSTVDFLKSSAGYVIRAGFSIENTVTPTTAATVGKLDIVSLLNTDENVRDNLTSMVDSTPANIPDSFKDIIWHAWGMCGKTHCLTTTGDIYRSSDGFILDRTKIGSIFSNPPKLDTGHYLPNPIGW